MKYEQLERRTLRDGITVFRIRPCGTIFSNADFSRCRLSASNEKFPQMYLRDLVFDTVDGLLWYVLISNSAEKATSSGAPRGFGDLGRMTIYFQGAGEHW